MKYPDLKGKVGSGDIMLSYVQPGTYFITTGDKGYEKLNENSTTFFLDTVEYNPKHNVYKYSFRLVELGTGEVSYINCDQLVVQYEPTYEERLNNLPFVI